MVNAKKEPSAAATATSAMELNRHYFISKEVLRQAHDLAYDILNLSVGSKYHYYFEISSVDVQFSVYDTESEKIIRKVCAYRWEPEKVDELFTLMESELEAIRSAG